MNEGRQRTATLPELIKINELLELHLKVKDASVKPILYVWDEGWDDETVATAIGGGLKKSHVYHARERLHKRNLYSVPKAESTLKATLAQANATIAALTERLTSQEHRFDQLVDRLQSKVALGQGWPALKTPRQV